MPWNLESSRIKQTLRPVHSGRSPGAAHLRAAGQLPQRLAIQHDGDRGAAAAAGALHSGMPMWQVEAAQYQRQARGGTQRPLHVRLGGADKMTKLLIYLTIAVPSCISNRGAGPNQ